MPTALHALTRNMARPVQEAYPAAMTWLGDMMSGVWLDLNVMFQPLSVQILGDSHTG